MRSLRILTLCLLTLSLQNTYAEYVEEIVVTGSRVSRSADAGPIVFTTKGDFLLQEINLIHLNNTCPIYAILPISAPLNVQY